MVLGPRSPQRVTGVRPKHSRVTPGAIFFFCVVSNPQYQKLASTPRHKPTSLNCHNLRRHSRGPRPEGPQEHRV